MLLCSIATATITYDEDYYQLNRMYIGAGKDTADPVYNNIAEAAAILEAWSFTSDVNQITFGDTTYLLPETDGTVGQALITDGSGTISWGSTSGTFSGGSITSDITMTNGEYIRPDTTTAHILGLQVYDVDNTAWRDALKCTNGDIADVNLGCETVTVQIHSTGLNVTAAGAVTGVTDLTMSGDLAATGDLSADNITIGTSLILDSGATITNAPASEITFTAVGEDLALDMDASTNVIGLKSSTGVTGIAMGAVDDLSGVGTIAFDAAAASITTATDGTAQDLTIGITGATNSSLVLVSSGTSNDAMSFTTSAGGIDITVGGAAAGEDLDLTSNTSINLTATEAAANQIYIQGQGTIAGNAVNIATTDGGVLIAAAGAANGDFTVTSADDTSITATDDLTLNGGSAGSIINLGTNTHGNVIHIGDNDTAADTITIGSAKDTTAITGIAMTVGSTATTAATTIQSGTGDVTITSTDAITMTSAGAFNIGANAVAQTITVGNETGASSLALKAGTGNITIDGVAATTITIGDAAQTGTMKFGESTAACQVDLATGNSNKTVNLGTGTGVSTINIGTGGTGAKTITIGDAASTGTTNIKAGTGGINITGSVIRTGQQYVQTISYCKVGSTSGWVIPAASDAAHVATLPQSQTASTLVIPITIPLKVGYTITAWTINGQIDSGGNTATLDAKLYKHTEATAGFANAAIGSGMAQLSKTADYKVVEGESGLSEVVAADESYYLLVTGTTAATTDIEIASITVTVSEI